MIIRLKKKTKMRRTPSINGSSAAVSEYLTIKQVAALLQVCTKTVRRLIREKGIPVIRVGRQIRIPVEHVALFTSKDW
jgi:excisionase family DNA binding protein